MEEYVIKIIDWGALSHLGPWASNLTCYSRLATFCLYIIDFNNGPNTKDLKNQLQGSKLSQTLVVDLNKKVDIIQEKFLIINKTKLFMLLGDNLLEQVFNIFET